jgi:hypothetical protein
MLIYRSLTDIAASRIGYLETTKPLEKSREEKYPYSDFSHEISIEIVHTYMSCIECECISFKYYYNIERADNIKKCHHITDTGNIVKCEFVKK